METTRTFNRWTAWAFVIALVAMIFFPSGASLAQTKVGTWDEIVGKRVVNYQGVPLGYVSDTAVDVEHGRYVGMLVSFGGVLGIGQKTVVVPPAALVERGTPRTLYLNMDKEAFHRAPTFPMGEKVDLALAGRIAEVYRYYGQKPYFLTVARSSATDRNLEDLGYIQKGSGLLLQRVENLRGEVVGTVFGFREMNTKTGTFAGVVIMPEGYSNAYQNKVVPPQALRYDVARNRLQIDDHDRPFSEYTDLTFVATNVYLEKTPPVVAASARAASTGRVAAMRQSPEPVVIGATFVARSNQ